MDSERLFQTDSIEASPSGTKALWTMNLCLDFSSPLKSKGWSMTRTLTRSLGGTKPELGRTQYCLGAVVLTLKQTFFSEGFLS